MAEAIVVVLLGITLIGLFVGLLALFTYRSLLWLLHSLQQLFRARPQFKLPEPEPEVLRLRRTKSCGGSSQGIAPRSGRRSTKSTSSKSFHVNRNGSLTQETPTTVGSVNLTGGRGRRTRASEPKQTASTPGSRAGQ